MSHDPRESDEEHDEAGAVVDGDTDDNEEYGSAGEHPEHLHEVPSEHLPGSSTSQLDHYVTVSERPSAVSPPSPTRSATPPPRGASNFLPSEIVAPENIGTSGPPRTRSSRVESLRVNNTRSNRLSGFFTSFRPRSTQAVAERPVESRPNSSKLITRPPEPPPPSLSPPSLDELGLSLQAITPNLSPSHFGTPPTSGTFMRPHFLLLCHSQGLDVLPLVAPPAPRAYALVRRVPFKMVVVMEERGVLVAIAGRRDGVRVYALEEIRKVIEWRMEFEVQRERERARREEAKFRLSFGASETKSKGALVRPGVYSVTLPNAAVRPPTAKQRSVPVPTSPPPRYASIVTNLPSVPILNVPPPPDFQGPNSSRRSGDRALSISSVVGRKILSGSAKHQGGADEKTDWMDVAGSDEEVLIAPGPSGSAALDERTSNMANTLSRVQVQSPELGDDGEEVEVGEPADPHPPSSSPMPIGRQHRPASLRLEPQSMPDSIPDQNSPAVTPSSPTPTVFSLQRAMMRNNAPPPLPPPINPSVRSNDVVSLAEVLQESRLPGRPVPLASLRIGSHTAYDPQGNEPDIDAPEDPIPSPSNTVAPPSTDRRRRRWSVMDTLRPELRPPSASMDVPRTPRLQVPRSPSLLNGIVPRTAPPTHFPRSQRSPSTPGTPRSAHILPRNMSNPGPIAPSSVPPQTPRRFFSRFIPAVLRKGHDKRAAASDRESTENIPPVPSHSFPSQAPAPKMEYVKLPGTKGALMIKAVETARKSFLAILCGDQGEKVELFAGTYRSALGLSRTFILPDSPRSLELQLQGDDLVELFLVFSQNVFGLEPATVRVREVRIGRAERRAARRRAALENQSAERFLSGEGSGEGRDGLATIGDEGATNIITSVVTVGNTPSGPSSGDRRRTFSDTAHWRPDGSAARPASSSDIGSPLISRTAIAPEELSAKAAAQLGPYSTFQQLSFAPRFPTASIADECVIPPTYTSYLDYREEWEKSYPQQLPETVAGNPSQAPALLVSPRWYYKDPKGILRGPWDVDTMYNWLRDGFLPPNLPLRQDNEATFITLRALQDSRPGVENPFAPSESNLEPFPSKTTSANITSHRIPLPEYLLSPISLLAQPRHFGPPALFFSSRGGHITSIVDGRGRSVLKGKFIWNSDRSRDPQSPLPLGDVRRLEAFDSKDNHAVLVAIRHGGIEAVNMSDALLQPADQSRTSLPFFNSPNIATSRRRNFVWRMGSPVEDVSSSNLSNHGISSKRETALPRKSVTLSKKIGSMKRTDGTKENEESPLPLSDNEILFLGRWGDHVYLCERTADSFRILRLSLAES
ncbi:uncharacterized protein EI90DRAFT_3043230 [Cantharellus anzutake]|uniref:uncharacterized protein n=1 Tax=Cantharellus anzutake TaxID=1750568 RepID=UPI0019037223|nr:uncharacterized protein EI90DRAFT_3043230 [Cantharellus anzutake]KAF8337515.1 hypothetical protein EI90DRAFT_3043230 [Cantharellus anzutake]